MAATKHFAGIVLPPEDLVTPEPRHGAPDALRAAVRAGQQLGYVNRDPAPARRKPGPRATEPQGKLTIAGPQRVFDAFRKFCDDQDMTLAQGLDALLEAHDQKRES